MDRIKEPSTWAALGIFFQVLKAFIPPTSQLYADALSAGAAAIAGALPEGGKAR